MKIGLAFRSFFNLLFGDELSPDVLAELGLTKKTAAPPKPVAPPPPSRTTSDGALQFLGILQRDSRLVDFLMEDIKDYSDDQIGAAVRELHDQCRDAMSRYVTLQPVVDGVEGTYSKAPTKDPNTVKFTGNVPAKLPDGGILRHKGWRAAKIDLPALTPQQDATILAPAEFEIE